MNEDEIITGERLQELADVYIGNMADFMWNPRIMNQPQKHKYISDFRLGTEYDNPRHVFCYSFLVPELANYIHLFKNPFVLITHNSDANIGDTDYVRKILQCDRLIRWFSQNVCIYLNKFDDKLCMLPIGLANSQWSHGNISELMNVMTQKNPKTKHIYMSFKASTNYSERQLCYEALQYKIPFLPLVNFQDNLRRMAEYKYCICPDGNGADTHRIWEALYLGVVPILTESTFSNNLRRLGFPCILVESWEKLDCENIDMNVDFCKVRSLLSMYQIREHIQQ